MAETLSILFLAANPLTTSRLSLDEEIREIQDKIRGATFQKNMSLEPYLAARPDDLLQAFNEKSPTMVHFSGHGTKAEMILTSPEGNPHPVSQEALTFLFGSLQHKVKMVVLNACFSEAQAKAIAAAVDLTIGMRTPISDAGAIIFAAAFYRAIAFGHSIQEAFNQGRAGLKLQGNGEEDIPQLITRPGIDPEKVTLITPPPHIDYSSLNLAFSSPIRLFFSHRMETLRPLLRGSLLLQLTANNSEPLQRQPSSKDLLRFMEVFIRHLKTERENLEKLFNAIDDAANRWSPLFPPACTSKLNKLVQVAASILGTTRSLLSLTQDMLKELQRKTRQARDERKRRELVLDELKRLAQSSEPLFTTQIAFTMLIGNSFNEFLAVLPDEAWANSNFEPVIWEFRMGDDQPIAGAVEIPEDLKRRLPSQ
jgi:hypothetical protein